jgi:hypothetical protein
LVQPVAWREIGAGLMRLELRCPECWLRSVGDYDFASVASFDRLLTEGRLELIAVHDAIVRTNMQEECDRLSRALADDLIGADDFAGYNR